MILQGILQFLASGTGTVAFSVMFGVPRKYYPACGTIGGLGWILYWICTNYWNVSAFLATLLATVFVAVTSRFAAARKKCPATIFLLSVIFPLVPGVGLYRTVYYLIMDETVLYRQCGREAFAAAIAIVLGITCAYELPQKWINRIAARFVAILFVKKKKGSK